jgi:hypothetical protein
MNKERSRFSSLKETVEGILEVGPITRVLNLGLMATFAYQLTQRDFSALTYLLGFITVTEVGRIAKDINGHFKKV